MSADVLKDTASHIPFRDPLGLPSAFTRLLNGVCQQDLVSGLLMYRYDAPLYFANVENFKQRSLEAIAAEIYPVEWLVWNMEANVEI